MKGMMEETEKGCLFVVVGKEYSGVVIVLALVDGPECV